MIILELVLINVIIFHILLVLGKCVILRIFKEIILQIVNGQEVMAGFVEIEIIVLTGLIMSLQKIQHVKII